MTNVIIETKNQNISLTISSVKHHCFVNKQSIWPLLLTTSEILLISIEEMKLNDGKLQFVQIAGKILFQGGQIVFDRNECFFIGSGFS